MSASDQVRQPQPGPAGDGAARIGTPQPALERERSAGGPALADIVAASPRTAAQRALSAMVDNSPRMRANHTGLPATLQRGVEALSGVAMDDVQVHYNSAAPAQLQALAYAQGADIHIAPGQERHLPHEAWHVAQQKQGRVQPTLQAAGLAINADPALEREADVMGARAASHRAGADDAVAAPVAPGGALQRMVVIQRFADTGAADAWLGVELPTFELTPARAARMQPFIQEFRDQIDLWRTYPSEINQHGAVELQTKLDNMLAMAIGLEQMEASVAARIAAVGAVIPTPVMQQALALTAPASPHRRYASAGQLARMTVLHGLYGGEVAARTAYTTQLNAIAAGPLLAGADMQALVAITPQAHRTVVLAAVAQALVTFPFAAHDPALDAEVAALRIAIEAAAVPAADLKFTALNTTLTAIGAAQTGTQFVARLTALRAFHTAHANGVLDLRDVDAGQATADALHDEARIDVNAAFAEIAATLQEVRPLITQAMAGEVGLAYPGELIAIDAFRAGHNNLLLDTRDYRPFRTRADQLNTDALAWEAQNFQGVGAAAPVTLPVFEAAAAPFAGRRTKFRRLVTQGTLNPGTVNRRFTSAQDVPGGYAYAFSLAGTANTVVHAHFLADDTLGGAHFKPGGAREGELGHAINQLDAGHIAAFVTAPKTAYDLVHGAMPLNLRA